MNMKIHFQIPEALGLLGFACANFGLGIFAHSSLQNSSSSVGFDGECQRASVLKSCNIFLIHLIQFISVYLYEADSQHYLKALY